MKIIVTPEEMRSNATSLRSEKANFEQCISSMRTIVNSMSAENFTTDEKNISEMFTSVESMIGSILSIRPIGAGNRTSNLPEGVMPICKSGGPEDFKLSSVIELASLKL